MIKLIGKLYNLFKFKEFSIKNDFIKVKFSFSKFIKLFITIDLSIVRKVIINKKKLIILKVKILFEKLNISFDAKEVT